MNTTYFPSQSLARRATVPISPMTSSAPLIDPHLDQYTMGSLQHRQLKRSQGQLNMQNQLPNQIQQSQMQNNGRLQSPMQSNVQQMQSPIQNTGPFQSSSNLRSSQSITPERVLPTKQVSQFMLLIYTPPPFFTSSKTCITMSNPNLWLGQYCFDERACA